MASYELPDGRTVSDSMAFTLAGIQYPSNWLLLSTPEDRKQRGILGPLPEPPWYDQRFYWGPNKPKDHTQLVDEWVGQTRITANTLLAPTDWIIIREVDNGKAADPVLKTWREDIRAASGVKIVAIRNTADTAELAAYITGTDYPIWPADPYAAVPIKSVSASDVESAGNGEEV
jgi:hypothetical protein